MKELIQNIFATKRALSQPVISFEFFPLKTEEGEKTFFEKTIPALLPYRPDFASVTYGAGGGTRDKTIGIVDRLQKDFDLTTMMHLTCVNSTQAQIDQVLRQAQALGIRNLLALRGDPPGGGAFQPVDGGFTYSYQLVDFIRQFGGFSIGVAGFPEGHIACHQGKHVDWDRLKSKIDAGADFVVTQLFFDNADFLEFRDYLVKHGVRVPLVPGIIPILSATQIKKFVALCGAKLPPSLVAELDRRADDDEAATEFGIDYATRQCQALLAEGVPGIHFYTLNKSRSITGILKNLGLPK